jgi:hypothetical protein
VVSRAVRRQLDAVLARSVHPDPARRFATAAELSTALQDCLVALGGRTGAPLGLRPRALALGVAALVVVALLAAVLLARRARARDAPRDPARAVVQPFRDEGVGVVGTGRDAGQPRLDAVAWWTHLPLVRATRVSAAPARHHLPALRQRAGAHGRTAPTSRA